MSTDYFMIKNKTSNGMEYYMTAISDKLISTVPNIAKDTQYWFFDGKSLRCKAYPEKTLDLVGVGDLNLNNVENDNDNNFEKLALLRMKLLAMEIWGL